MSHFRALVAQRLKLSVLLKNFIYIVTDRLGRVNFWNIFYSAGPVVQTWIGWQRQQLVQRTVRDSKFNLHKQRRQGQKNYPQWQLLARWAFYVVISLVSLLCSRLSIFGSSGLLQILRKPAAFSFAVLCIISVLTHKNNGLTSLSCRLPKPLK